MTTNASISPEDRSTTPERVAVIGAGVSGIAAANGWKKCAYAVTVFEASDRVGGHWTKAYPGVRLQNTAPQYQFGEFPWPFDPDRHPTGEQVLRYIEAAVVEFDLDVRLGHRITDMKKESDGWTLTVNGRTEHYAYVIIATGLYPGGSAKYVPPFPGMGSYKGKVMTSIHSHDVVDGKHVAIIGFGKTALDFASWSAPRAAKTTHIFRTPRWTIPDRLLGIDYTRPFFSRMGSDMMPSWVHSSAPQRFLHEHLGFVVRGFWFFIASLILFQHRWNAKLRGVGKQALDAVIPPKSQFLPDLRSATALAPDDYYGQVAHGDIRAVHAEVASFYYGGLILTNGEHVEADLVCVCCGNAAPTYPFLPADVRRRLEGRPGGPALYRHLLHPDVANLGFAGCNTGFLHIALAELGALWQVAVRRGDVTLPSREDMAAEAERVAAWKKEHTTFAPTCNLDVNSRFQQCLDTLLQEIGVSQWRKLPNLLAEFFARYDPTDYKGVVAEYLTKSAEQAVKTAKVPMPTVAMGAGTQEVGGD